MYILDSIDSENFIFIIYNYIQSIKSILPNLFINNVKTIQQVIPYGKVKIGPSIKNSENQGNLLLHKLLFDAGIHN